MRMASWAADRAASESVQDIQPFLQKAFMAIATAQVSNSAYEGKSLGYLPADTQILMNGDRRFAIAKDAVRSLDREGYLPPPQRSELMVLGRPTRALFEQLAYTYRQGGYASEYDEYLAKQVAYVLTGGELTAPSRVSEDYLLTLEREEFLPLLAQPKTQERVTHLLTMKKPLRN
jgi:3-hydroxyacyl-CoA dehydrogenase